ncbi:MAG: lysine exporter LysO family protein [Spirochaetales bacterium]|nr:lysine exporter LysO family protein [Spirochaetales bacterium]
MSSLWITTFLVLGFAALGYFFVLLSHRFRRPIHRKFVSRTIGFFLWFLIFSMGFNLGANSGLVAQLGNLGFAAAVLAILSAGGSVLVAFLVFPRGFRVKGLGKGGTSDTPPTADPTARAASADASAATATGRLGFLAHFRDPARLLGALALGVVAGYLVPALPLFGGDSRASSVLLYILLFFSGAGMALENPHGLGGIFSGRTVALPLATIIGSLAGGALAAAILGWDLTRGLAGAAGFGWYSLSGVLIADLGDPFLGSAAFLGNLLRESLAIIFIPLLARGGLKPSSIAIAGATSMDVTLPMISRYAGYEHMATSMAHGVILSVLVPVFIPFLMALGQ